MSVRLVIETEGKGRSFSALVLARVYAGAAWSAGVRERGIHRPALMLLGCAESEAGAIRANLHEGRKMRFFGDGMSGHGGKGEVCEVLKSERFAISSQRVPEGTLLLIRHPGLFVWSPGMVSSDVRFVCLPGRALLESQAARFDTEATARHLQRAGFAPWTDDYEPRKRLEKAGARLVQDLDDPLFPAFAALLVAGIAQRVSFPILDAPLFWAQLAAALIYHGLVVRHSVRYGEEVAPYAEVGTTACGYYPGACVVASQEQIGEVLAAETASFLRR